MTSTTETAGHPDVAEISDLTEGLLEPSQAADVRRHLDECELCADVYASLEEIRGLLGTLPGPPRMPADVTSRIDAALAAEALLHATAPEAVDSQPPVAATIQSDSSTADGSSRVSRETSAAADRPSGRAHVSTTGPGRKRQMGGRRRGVVLGAVFTAAALGFGSVLLSSMNDGKPSGPEAGGQHSTSADTFAEGKLEKQVTDLLATSRSGGSGSRSPHTRGSESVPGNEPKILRDPIPVPGCVQKGIGRSDSALASEPGTYKGTDALLVVLPDTSDTSHVMAYIMDTACVADPSVGKAKVLLKQSYARS
ncbi:anti-sigma factor family protein [Streptomyces sp. NPDC005263]|uniref:anti-sigma factor family protein n=1 Tax=Streptomyces sp. NPDC005263 TaxID=3364711 RepID=UPI0036CE9C49